MAFAIILQKLLLYLQSLLLRMLNLGLELNVYLFFGLVLLPQFLTGDAVEIFETCFISCFLQVSNKHHSFGQLRRHFCSPLVVRLEFGQRFVHPLLQHGFFFFEGLDLVIDFVSDAHHHISLRSHETVGHFVIFLFYYFERIYAIRVLLDEFGFPGFFGYFFLLVLLKYLHMRHF